MLKNRNSAPSALFLLYVARRRNHQQNQGQQRQALDFQIQYLQLQLRPLRGPKQERLLRRLPL